MATGLAMPDRFGSKRPREFRTLVYVSMPQPGLGFKDIDPHSDVMSTVISQIASRFRVEIAVDDSGTMFSVAGPYRQAASDAINALREHLKTKPGEKTVWHPFVLVSPPNTGKDGVTIILQEKKGWTGSRPTVKDEPLISMVDESAISAAKTEFKDALKDALACAVQNLRYIPNKMRMRVYFGRFMLKEWKKDQEEYTFQELAGIARRAGPRGTSRMDKLIGTPDIAKTLREIFTAAGYVPRTIRNDKSSDVKPVHSLILLTKNLMVESVLDAIQAQGKSGQIKYTFGPPTAYHRERHHRAIKIVVSSPDNRHDWTLDIQTQVDEFDRDLALPFTNRDLRKYIIFTGDVLSSGFPSIVMYDFFAKSQLIENVMGKTTWTYMLNNTYSVEISIHHKWGVNTRAVPQIGAGLALYGCDWDDDMETKDVSTEPRPWEEFSKQFLHIDNWGRKVDKKLDGYDDFLNWIQHVQSLLNKAAKDDD
ncbi:hypothetical protein B0H63DRAFT_31820 [Podospora didyma]|uniref:DUF7905 domain-containing protein n=1 Tax=Podospora didyma TaxID=330526 RepID=A0AAE0U854_9PEZI|nr:hypothetical protein B0H63DRAFT_31820 [Podospora didyma]